MAILKLKQEDGSWAEVPALIGKNGKDGKDGKDGTNGLDGKDGANGKTAYEYAQDGGYGGTEAQFTEKLANGFGGLHIGSSTPPDTADVWVDPNGEPTTVEDWEFDMDDGTVETKAVVVTESEDATNGNKAAILRVRQADGLFAEIPALKGTKGEDGKDGANGKDGTNGKDGVNGIDGKDGADGVSCTHSWNGTTLTVTSASGTSSADLKGAKGDSYVLTDADRANIATQVKNSLATENWTFTLESGETVTKAVYIG